MDVDAGDRVDTRRRCGELRHGREPEEVVKLLDRTEDAEIEDGAEVDVEALGPLPGEHLAHARKIVDGSGRQ